MHQLKAMHKQARELSFFKMKSYVGNENWLKINDMENVYDEDGYV